MINKNTSWKTVTFGAQPGCASNLIGSTEIGDANIGRGRLNKCNYITSR